jgi:hypothetical protein
LCGTSAIKKIHSTSADDKGKNSKNSGEDKALTRTNSRKLLQNESKNLSPGRCNCGCRRGFWRGEGVVSAVAEIIFAALVNKWGVLPAEETASAAFRFGVALFYQHERLASLERVAAKMPGLFDPNKPFVAFADNPLTKIVWFAAVCLIVFGPADLWIAHLQKRRRRAAPPV